MGSLYTAVTTSNYNSNPPSDDGSQTSSNRVQWSTQKTKLADPIKTAYDTSETNTAAAFAKTFGAAGITSTSLAYTVAASDQGKLVKVTGSGGITITTPDATSVNSPFAFAILNNATADITLAGNNPGAQQTVDGANTVTIPSGNGLICMTDGSNWFTGGQNFSRTQIAPQGRLTLVSGTPIITSDQTAKTAVYYTPYSGDLVPIPNGSTFSVKEFSELTLTLNGTNYIASSIYDVFIALDPADSTTVIVGTGPAWTTATAGSGARGTGAGTTELVLLKGLNVNKNAVTLRNNATTYSVSAKSATYVGSIYLDGTNGQISCHVGFGQSRKFGVWNAFNRRPIILKAGDSTTTWNYGTATYRASNNSSANSMSLFTGLPEEYFDLSFIQAVSSSGSANATLGIGYNSTTVSTGFAASTRSGINAVATVGNSARSQYIAPPSLGVNVITALEKADAGSDFAGTEAGMLLTGHYSG